MDEQLDKLSLGHQKLRDEIHIPVSATAVRFVRLAEPELGEELIERREGRRLSAVVFVPVHMENLFSRHRQHS